MALRASMLVCPAIVWIRSATDWIVVMLPVIAAMTSLASVVARMALPTALVACSTCAEISRIDMFR